MLPFQLLLGILVAKAVNAAVTPFVVSGFLDGSVNRRDIWSAF